MRGGKRDDIPQEVRVCVYVCVCVCVCVLCNFPFNLASATVEGLPWAKEEGMTFP